MGRTEVLVGGACVFGIRNGRAGVPNAGDDEGMGSEVPILKRSECCGVDVGIVSCFQAVVLSICHEIGSDCKKRYTQESKWEQVKEGQRESHFGHD